MEPTITEQQNALAQTMGTGFIIFFLAIMIFLVIVQWKIFTKAGQPGWACLVPIYGAIVYFKIIGRSAAWLFVYIILGVLYGIGIFMAVQGSAAVGGVLAFIGIITLIVISIIDTHRLSKSFGQGGGFTAGLILLSIVFYPMLAFGNYQYIGPNGDGPNPNADPEILHA